MQKQTQLSLRTWVSSPDRGYSNKRKTKKKKNY